MKQPSPSLIPEIQLSFNEGNLVCSLGIIIGKFCFNSFSLKVQRKVKNLAFLLGNIIFPLNNKQIRKIFLKS